MRDFGGVDMVGGDVLGGVVRGGATPDQYLRIPIAGVSGPMVGGQVMASIPIKFLINT